VGARQRVRAGRGVPSLWRGGVRVLRRAAGGGLARARVLHKDADGAGGTGGGCKSHFQLDLPATQKKRRAFSSPLPGLLRRYFQVFFYAATSMPSAPNAGDKPHKRPSSAGVDVIPVRRQSVHDPESLAERRRNLKSPFFQALRRNLWVKPFSPDLRP
jgi:hypothetical protein